MRNIPKNPRKINGERDLGGSWLLKQLLSSSASPNEILRRVGISPSSRDGRSLLYAFSILEGAPCEVVYNFAPEIIRVFDEILVARKKRLDKREGRSLARSLSRGGKV